MSWKKQTGQEVDPTALEHKPHGGTDGKATEDAWIKSEKAGRTGDDKDVDSPVV
ncbi:MAG: hypothetical protein AAB729_05500 [Patescibacteria group bacterium]